MKNSQKSVSQKIKERIISRSENYEFWLYLIRQSALAKVGIFLTFFVIITAILAPYITPDPLSQNLDESLAIPSLDHFFGTDRLGRDVFSRVIHGSRISLTLGIIAVAISIIVGTLVGLGSGYIGGKVDEFLMRVTDLFLAFPPLVMEMAIAAALGPSLENIMIAVSVRWWPRYARLIRSSVLSVKQNLFVEAAKASGQRGIHTVFRHILPNSISPIVVQSTLDLGLIINVAAALGFLGMGAQPPTPEWGTMINEARNVMLYQWWLAFFPGVFLFITVVGLNLIGDWLNDCMNPKLVR